MGGDAELVERLRSGDQEAFVALVRRYNPTLTRLAATYVPGRAAEEVARDTWPGMLCGLDGFDGRASLRAWLFAILVSRARSADDRWRHSVRAAGYAAGPGRFPRPR